VNLNARTAKENGSSSGTVARPSCIRRWSKAASSAECCVLCTAFSDDADEAKDPLSCISCDADGCHDIDPEDEGLHLHIITHPIQCDTIKSPVETVCWGFSIHENGIYMSTFSLGSTDPDYDMLTYRPQEYTSGDIWRSWSEDCHHTHPTCSKDAPPKLPTRVLELSEGCTRLRLVLAHERKARYAALSHCWGNARSLITSDDVGSVGTVLRPESYQPPRKRL
jgi:hypothetical protein